MSYWSKKRISAGGGKLTRWQFAAVFPHQLLGALATATAVGTYTEFLADLRIAVALSDGLLNLLMGNGFAQAHVHNTNSDENYCDSQCKLNAKDLQ